MGFVPPLGLAAALLLAAARPAAGASAEAKRRELGSIKKELETARRQAEDYRRQEEALGRDLLKLETRSAQAVKKLGQLQTRVRDAERRKVELKDRLAALGQVGGVWRSALESDLAAYQAARASREDAFDSSGLWSESFRRAAISEKAGLLAGLTGASRSTELAAAETRRSAQRLQNRAREAQLEHQDSERQYQEKKAAIAETKEREAATLARVRELEENAAALTRLIRSLGKTSRARTAVGKLDLPAHSLPWPAAGSVVRPFGRQRNAELDAWVINQGVLFATQARAPVKAVDRGRVIFSGPFRSYGQVLIVDHGSNFFTIYGELGATTKGKGDRVGAGEVIARAGGPDPGSGTLYLEIRRGTEALDPMIWLKRH